MTGCNRSAAVMQQRNEPHDSLDDFPTPPWAARALCEALVARGELLAEQHAWEPACNRMHLAGVLGEYFQHVLATDIHDYGDARQDAVCDFLINWAQDAPDVDWIITNPPFRLGADFIRQGLAMARRGVAVFVRSAFVEGVDRWNTIFRDTPPALVMPFVERVVLWRGVLLNPDLRVCRDGSGRAEKPTTATAYCWLVWQKEHHGPAEHSWIPPCRRELTRPGDYPAIPDHLRPPTGSLI